MVLPRPATALALLMAVLAAALPGCGREVQNPFASWQTRCAALGAARFDVVSVPLSMVEDDSLDTAALTTRSGENTAQHRTFGLTSVSFGHATTSEMRVIEERSTGRACGSPHVRVELSMQPVVVYLARELARAPCRREATREHELRHVAIYRAMLDESTQALAASIATGVGAGVRTAASPQALQREFEASLR
jgi:hypothetical protein